MPEDLIFAIPGQRPEALYIVRKCQCGSMIECPQAVNTCIHCGRSYDRAGFRHADA